MLLPERVLLTGILRSASAAESRLPARMPVSATNLRFGSRSVSARGNAVRSRSRHRMSKGASFFAASSAEAKAS